jgi:competence protein ComEC
VRIQKSSGLIILVVLLLADIALANFYSTDNLLKVAFLDVGQGDAIFIESPSAVQVLVDTGPPGKILGAMSPHLAVNDRHIDVLILSHPDMDHIGGVLDVLHNYEIGTLFISGDYSNAEYKNEILKLARLKEIQVIEARRGQVIDLGAGVFITILFPDRNSLNFENNTASIALKLTYGEIDFLLTGDLPMAIEDFLVELDGQFLDIEVLKLSHHGSKTSTSEKFVSVTNPQFAIVSAGAGNRYNHPSAEVLERLNDIEVLQTMDLGTILFKSDGQLLFR